MNLYPSYKFLKTCFIRLTKAVLTLHRLNSLFNKACFTSIKDFFGMCVQNNSVVMHFLKKHKKTVSEIHATAKQ